MVLSPVPRKKSPVTPPGIDPEAFQLLVQRLNLYATPGPNILSIDDRIPYSLLKWTVLRPSLKFLPSKTVIIPFTILKVPFHVLLDIVIILILTLTWSEMEFVI